MPDNKNPADLHSVYEKIHDERRRRVEEHKRSVALKKAEAGRQLNILADGDSWFSYPLSWDVIDYVRQDGNPTPIVLNLAVAGDPTTATLGVEKREQIINTLSDPEQGEFDALLFSGGGDDVAGDQFCLWITDNTGSDRGINQKAFSDILGVVETAYRDLFAICGDIQPNCKIFIHSYDFARPTGVGACPLLTGGYARGPWLKPSLDYRQWTDFTSASALVEALLRELDTLFLALEGEYKPRVVYVKTQGTLIPPQSIDDKTSDWANELHPTEPGFEKIATKFLAALRNSFPGRI